MPHRLTPNWTKTLTEAYGPTGSKGERGEVHACRLLQTMGFQNVTHHPSSLKLQKAGIDITFTVDNEIYAVDVKNNLAGHKDVCVEFDKLLNSEADFWMHVNDEDENDHVFYEVEQMIKYLSQFSPQRLFWVSRDEIQRLEITLL